MSAAQSRHTVLKGFQFVAAWLGHLAATQRFQSGHVGAAAAHAGQTAHHGGHLLQVLAAALGQLLDHVGHLPVLFQQTVDVLNVHTGTGCDTLLTAGIQQVGLFALLLGH